MRMDAQRHGVTASVIARGWLAVALLADGDMDALLSHGLDDRLAADVSRFGAEATVMTDRS